MCGVLGIFGPNARQMVSNEVFSAALDTLAHRGPDGGGIVSFDAGHLGHRRLAIIDLSDNGLQPMTDHETGVVLSFNGEIYNYLELREQLQAAGHTFRSCSDTEVLLKAYLQWDEDCVRRLNGMFAFCVFDPRRGDVLLARDRFGVKPLYFTNAHEVLAFASEPKALLALRLRPMQHDPLAARDFLLSGRYAAGSRTFVKSVQRLPAAHCMRFSIRSPSSARTWRYWHYPQPETRKNTTEEEVFDEFKELLEASVKLRLRSDVPVALSLSGGLDSTAILSAIAQRLAEPPRCFTSIYDEEAVSEISWARKAAAAVDTTVTSCLSPSRDWTRVLAKCVHHLDGPVSTPAVIPLWHLMSEVRRQGIKVLMEGQGADELLGGYVQYAVASFLGSLRSKSLGEAARSLRSGYSHFGLKNFAYTLAKHQSPSLVRQFRRMTGYYDLLRPLEGSLQNDEMQGLTQQQDGRVGVDARLWLDHSEIQLPRLLHYGDAISMAHGVEARNPFMDYRLVEWACRLPPAIRIKHYPSKWMIRRYLANSGQKEISERKDKKGYPTPFLHWVSSIDAETLAHDFRADASIFEYVDRKSLLSQLNNRDPKKAFGGNLAFRIIALNSWMSHVQLASEAPSKAVYDTHA